MTPKPKPKEEDLYYLTKHDSKYSLVVNTDAVKHTDSWKFYL